MNESSCMYIIQSFVPYRMKHLRTFLVGLLWCSSSGQLAANASCRIVFSTLVICSMSPQQCDVICVCVCVCTQQSARSGAHISRCALWPVEQACRTWSLLKDSSYHLNKQIFGGPDLSDVRHPCSGTRCQESLQDRPTLVNILCCNDRCGVCARAAIANSACAAQVRQSMTS